MPGKAELDYKKKLDDFLVGVGRKAATVGRKLTTPLIGKPYTDEELIAKPGRIGSPEHVLGMATSPYDVISNALPFLKGAGASAAVMLPILRGNKALQAERLAKLKFPGPANSTANQSLEYYKKKYPRLMAHQEPPIFENESDSTYGSLLGGIEQFGEHNRNALPVTDPNRNILAFRSRMSMHPDLENAPLSTVMDTQAHELSHAAQSLSNKFGTPKYQGLSFPHAYQAFEDAYGYTRVPFERQANRTAMSQVIRKELGSEKLKNIPVKDRTGFTKWLDSNPTIDNIRLEARARITEDKNIQGGKEAADVLKEYLNEAYEYYIKNIKGTDLSRATVIKR